MSKKFVNTVLLLISTFVSLEIVSAAYFGVVNGEFYYTRGETEDILSADGNVNATNDFNTKFGLPGLRIHPLLGWVSADSAPGYNREGFFSPVEYPSPASPKKFVIGVFGESVAFNFWNWSTQSGAVAKHLSKRVPALAEKEIVILNFAKEGYRTPQNVNALSYFLLSGQKFDLVVNIGGYNEVTGVWSNLQQGVNPAFPTTSLILAMASLTSADRLSRDVVAVYQGKYMRADARMCSLAMCWLYHETYGAYLESTAAGALTKTTGYDQENNVVFVPTGTAKAGNYEFEGFFSTFWEQSVRMMHGLSETGGARFLHIIQPNQYVETGREFSAEERTIAFTNDPGHRKLVKSGYGVMTATAPKLRDAGIRVVSAVNVFDATPEPVYRDNCCHFNEAGEAVFAGFVAREIAKIYDSEEKPAN